MILKYKTRYLYNKLKQGYTLVSYTQGTMNIDATITKSFGLIHYSHYGSSAIRVNYQDFIWLINNIFNDIDVLVPITQKQYNNAYKIMYPHL